MNQKSIVDELSGISPGGDSEMFAWMQDLFPINRSLTGEGVSQTLRYLRGRLPDLTIESVPSGTAAFDWTVPDEWIIRDAYVTDESGQRIIDFNTHNLHVMGYSEPIDLWLSLEELDAHLYSLPNQPTAIPYVTSYYQRRWGFCLTHKQRQSLQPGRYRAVVDSELKPGVLNYGELLLRGESDAEVLLSTYLCHPSLANDNLSGPVVATALAHWLGRLKRRHYTYRIIFVPETIGSLVYISRHLAHLKAHVVAGFNLSCLGDEGGYSYLPSRAGDTLADRVACHALNQIDPTFTRHGWRDRSSDERQYCAPGIDLPVASIMRSKHGQYPEYHSSLDNLDLVTPAGLEGGFMALRTALETLEHNGIPQATVLGEPQLGRRGLYPTLSMKNSGDGIRLMMDLLSYADGQRDLLAIAELIDVPMMALAPLVQQLHEHDLLEFATGLRLATPSTATEVYP